MESGGAPGFLSDIGKVHKLKPASKPDDAAKLPTKEELERERMGSGGSAGTDASKSGSTVMSGKK